MSDAPDTVTLTIDGKEMTVPKGTLVIRAAEQLGIIIPRFCDHPLLDPVGACRQCLVEIEGGPPKPMTACTTEASDGWVVHTHMTSDVAEKAQKGQLEFLLINHPLDCPMCDKGGECPLQDQALAHGSQPLALHRREAPLRQAGGGLRAGAARPRALRAVCPLHPLLRPDLRRPVHRAVRTRRARAGRDLRGRALRVVLLGQRHPDLPGRGADLDGLPLQGAPVRPAQRPERLRPLLGRLLADRPVAARPGRAAARPHQHGRQRDVELRPWPLRLRPPDRTRSAHHAAGAAASRPRGPRP